MMSAKPKVQIFIQLSCRDFLPALQKLGLFATEGISPLRPFGYPAGTGSLDAPQQ